MQHRIHRVSARNRKGRGASRRLRRSGQAPGHRVRRRRNPQPIELDHNALIHALQKEAFHSSILTMKLDGASTQRVLLRDVQMHPFRNEVLHVDFQRVDENRKIHIKVPLHFMQRRDLAGGARSTDAIIQPRADRSSTSRACPKDLPAFIEVDLSDARRRTVDPRVRSDHAAGRDRRDARHDRAHGGRDTAIVPRVCTSRSKKSPRSG